MKRVKLIDPYTIEYPKPLEETGGRWISNFDLSDDETLVAAGYDKWFDPASITPPPDEINCYRPTYAIDGENVVYGSWEKIERQPDLAETIMLQQLIEGNSTGFSDELLFQHSDIIPEWRQDNTYKRGAVVQDEGNLYASLHDMLTTAQNTKSSETPSMWRKVGDPAQEWPEWIQPVGSEGAYMTGGKVSHGGNHWVSLIDNNVLEPSESVRTIWRKQ